VKPEQYHSVLIALDQVLKALSAARADFSADDRELLRHVEHLRSEVLKAESGHPFPLQTLTPPARKTEGAETEPLPVPGLPEVSAEAWAKRIRVLIVDDHEAVRTVLRALLATESDFNVVAEAANGREAVELAGACHPDVIIMDLNMPVLDGVSATREALRVSPESKVIVFSANRESSSVQKSIAAGAVGYICKPASRKVLMAALRAVHDGKTAFENPVGSPELRRR
jgi:CheY-like chemotaxis protein